MILFYFILLSAAIEDDIINKSTRSGFYTLLHITRSVNSYHNFINYFVNK